MFALLFILFVVAAGVAAFAVYRHRSEHYKKLVLPLHKQSIISLVKDLHSSSIEIVPCLKSNLRSQTVTILSAGEYIDNEELLSRDKYDDYKILINGSLKSTFDFDHYLNSKSLPKAVRNELKSFHSVKFDAADRSDSDYFALFPENEEAEIITTELFAVDGEAFECWLSFKECSHNLNFVIEQWIQENCESKEINHIHSVVVKKKKAYSLDRQSV
jgi:hypothetical protein